MTDNYFLFFIILMYSISFLGTFVILWLIKSTR